MIRCIRCYQDIPEGDADCLCTEHSGNYVALAEVLARYAHYGVTRKDGVTPYITHPERVAARLIHPVAKAAAWLHDVIEDTEITAVDLLKAGIPAAVVETVLAVSQRKGEETYKQYVRRVAASGRIAIAVKLADLADNVQDAANLPPNERGLVHRWQASQRTLLAVGADLKGLLRLSE